MPITNLSSLQSSPVFNMSLSSKELFHSNFLAWAIEQYPTQAKEFFCGVLNFKLDDKCKCECECQENSSCITEIEREEKNIDLSFIICNYCSIYIENKFKSIAYAEQLDEYSEKLSKKQGCKKFILLSLKTPKFFKDSIYTKQNQKDWKLVTYEELLNDFYCEVVNDEKIECYEKGLIQDYIKSFCIIINQALSVFDCFNQGKECGENNQYCISNLHQNGTTENNILKKFQKIRLQDLLQKGIYEDFAHNLYQECSNNNILPKPIIYGKDVQKPNHISIHFDYSRNQGLVDIRYTTQNGCSLGVQIQGNEYRQYVLATNKNKEAEKFAECLFCNQKPPLWFNGLDKPKFNEKQAKKALKLCENGFKSFKIKDGRLFIYRSMPLPQPISNSDLIKKIISDMQQAIKIQNCDC